jgi:hypothetical protein
MKVVTSKDLQFLCGAIPYHKIKVSEYSTMNRRWHWREALDAEMRQWSALPYDQLIARLNNADVYEVKHDSRTYQVEIEVLENTEKYVHVVLSPFGRRQIALYVQSQVWISHSACRLG